MAAWFRDEAITSTSHLPYTEHFGRVWDNANAPGRTWKEPMPGRASAPKLRELKALLSETREGREAVATMERYGVKVRFLDGIGGGISFRPKLNAVVIAGDYYGTALAAAVVHEMVHAKEMNTGKLPIPTEMKRGFYVRASVAAEARASSKEAELLMRGPAWREHGRYSATTLAYRDAYAKVFTDARADAAAAAKTSKSP